MNINELTESKYLKRADVGEGTIVTIKGTAQHNVAKQGEAEEHKWILYFQEFEKGLVLNPTNGQLIAAILKSEESEQWNGKQVELFDDPTVGYAGKLVGGIRVRAVPKGAVAGASAGRMPALPGGSSKAALKAKFKAHPEFGKKLLPNDINAYLTQNYGAKLDELSEEAAKDALSQFDVIVEAAMDDIPF